MQDLLSFFQTEKFGIEMWRLSLALGLIFLSFLSRSIIRIFVTNQFKRLTSKTSAQWDDEAAELLPPPLGSILQIILWILALNTLQLPNEPVNLDHYLNLGLKVALAVCVVWLLMRVIDVFANILLRASAKTDSKLDDQLIPLGRKSLKVAISILAAIQVIQNLGYSVTSLLAGLGVGGLALALAAQDTVSNFFGSVVIFADRPFQVGDWILHKNIEGTVEEVGFRTTRIRRFDKALVVVPNSSFSSEPITNFTSRHIRRIKFVVGLTYETNSKQMQKFLEEVRELLKTHPGIDQNFHFAKFVNFNESSLDVLVYCFANTIIWTDYLEIQETLMLKMMEIVEAHGLEIAFRTQTLYHKNIPDFEQTA